MDFARQLPQHCFWLSKRRLCRSNMFRFRAHCVPTCFVNILSVHSRSILFIKFKCRSRSRSKIWMAWANRKKRSRSKGCEIFFLESRSGSRSRSLSPCLRQFFVEILRKHWNLDLDADLDQLCCLYLGTFTYGSRSVALFIPDFIKERSTIDRSHL